MLEQPLVLDVRAREEFETGNHPGSLNIPLPELSGRVRELDPRRPILVCCEAGTQCLSAKALLEQKGFTRVRNAGSWQRIEHMREL